MTQVPWTVQSVKEQRPTIKVKVRPEAPHKEQIVDGMIGSHPDGFAFVRIRWFGVSVGFQVAWDTVVRCLNENKAILY